MNASILKLLAVLVVAGAVGGGAYGAVRHAGGEASPPPETTVVIPTLAPGQPTPSPEELTPPPPPTIGPVIRPTPAPVTPHTPVVPPELPRPEEIGERVPGGTVFDKYGPPILLPAGVGDFRSWVGVSDPGGWFMAIYHIETESTLFLVTQEGAKGLRLVEGSRHVVKPEANQIFDAIVAQLDVPGQ